MPSGKNREFDDTWKKDELEKSIKGSRRSGDRDHTKHRDEDDRRHRKKDDDDRRRHKDRENGDAEKGDKDRHRSSRNKDQDDREKRHRKKDETGTTRDGDTKARKPRDETEEERQKRKERERRHRDKDSDREKRHKDDDKRKDNDRERRHKDDDRERRNKDDDREKRHKDGDRERRHKDKDGERERRHRNDENEDNRRDKDEDEERRKRKEEKRRKEKEQDRDTDRERENERQRERDKNRERDMEKEQEKQRERERRREKERQERELRKAEEGERKKALSMATATVPQVDKEEAAGDDYGDYEDDFEDYDDDFEDEEEEVKPARNKSRADVDEVKQAMDEENERLLRESKQPHPQSDDSFEEYTPDRRHYEDDEPGKSWGRPKTAQRTFINFTSAKQRQLTSTVANKARRRGIELAQIIELDIARFDLFDMPPVSEYELYMRTFGGSNTKQAIIQTNEDNIEREIQTDEIETHEKWSQHPPESLECVGGPDTDANDNEDLKPIDQVKLGKFLQYAAQTMLYLMEEERLGQESSRSSERKSNICLSEAFTELHTTSIPALKGRHVTHSYFSPAQSHMLLTVFSHSDTPSKGSELNCGAICVWNINEPQSPQKLLVSESRPRCCCFSPIKSHLAFAGMHDGSLAVWDLRESSSMHIHKNGVTCRYPTYSTAGVLQYDNHQSPVIALQPVVAQAESSIGELGRGTEGEGLNFQLISLEEDSIINLWVVSDIGHPDSAGSQSELGLSPGGRVKLTKSSVINLQNPLRDARLRSTMRSYNMQLLPSNNSHFYVTTNVGCVLHGVRYGGKAPPSVHWTEETDSLAKITSIDFSPFTEPVFLTGSDDGTLRLHHTSCDYALITWPNATQGVPIECVRWCRSRPSVFFVLDQSSRMHIWDLLMSDADPMKYEQIAKERVTCFELSNDHSATGLGTMGRKPQMVVCMEGGACEVHTVSREFSALMNEEIQQFSQLVQSLT